MKRMLKKLAMMPKGLRYKLMIAFSLMSIIPLLVCAYLVLNYIFPHLDNITDISLTVVFSVVIAILGLGLAKGLIDPVIDMAIEARVIASGDYDRKITVAREDEIGNLGESINVMTQKIRTNLDELKSYGQRTREINLEIHKKVLALSSLLQIGDIIATGSMELKGILDLAMQKVSMVFDTGFGVLYMPKIEDGDLVTKASYNIENEKLEDLVIEPGQGLLGGVFKDRSVAVIDDSSKKSRDMEDFKASYNVKNILGVPLHSGRKNIGLLLVGNRLDDFKYKADDIDLINVFAKQITIAIENDVLIKKTEDLAVIDDLTGLYNKNYILTRLEEEIRRAIFYQRPCSFIIFNIDEFRVFRETHGELVAEEVLKKMAKLIKDNTPPIGKAARVGGDEFAILAPEKNKREIMDIADDVRKKVESTNFSKEGKISLRVSAGISENPVDGATADELFKKAQEALRKAKASGKNRVVA